MEQTEGCLWPAAIAVHMIEILAPGVGSVMGPSDASDLRRLLRSSVSGIEAWNLPQ